MAEEMSQVKGSSAAAPTDNDILDTPEQISDIFQCSTGVILHLRKVNRMLVADAIERIKYPEVPVVHDNEKDRDLPNLDDPDYLKAREEVDNRRGRITVNIYIARGSYPKHIPDGIFKPDDDAWITDIEELTDGALDLGTKGSSARYLNWLKYIALGPNEWLTLWTAIARYTNAPTQEGDVAKATAGFQDTQMGGTDSGSQTSTEIPDRN